MMRKTNSFVFLNFILAMVVNNHLESSIYSLQEFKIAISKKSQGAPTPLYSASF